MFIARRQDPYLPNLDREYPEQEFGVVRACQATLQSGMAQAWLNAMLQWKGRAPGRKVCVAMPAAAHA